MKKLILIIYMFCLAQFGLIWLGFFGVESDRI